MKIRTGFVSNSSSSSFVAILTADTYAGLGSRLSPSARIVAGSRWSSITEQALNEVPMVVYSSMSGEQNDCPVDYDRHQCVEFAQELLNVAVDEVCREQLQRIIETLSEDEDDVDSMARRLQRQIRTRERQQDVYEAQREIKDIYYTHRQELESVLESLEKEGKCLITSMNF